ncbi:MAG TPA: hypothetical protein VKQ32_11155 [Polyangia bacterium]|nr:hypothetical protein [Polyangia bacterium]
MRHWIPVRAVTTIGLAIVLAAAPPALARRKARSAPNAKTVARAQPKEPPLPAPQGKFAVFTFEGEGAHRVQQQVIASLRAKGLKVITNLRPLDSAEQYREMAVTLNLVAYLDGEYIGDGDQASATVYVRSGVTGLRSTSTTFAGEKRTLPAEVGKGLWERISPDLSRLCVDAAKPRKLERAPLRIEAGTPLENRPADASN